MRKPLFIHKTNLWVRANGVYLSLGVIVMAFGAILLLLADSQSKLAQQNEQDKKVLLELKAVTEQISKAAATRTEQINGIDRHLDCIVAFFAQPDRSQKAIANIETCQLQDIDTGETQSATLNSTPVRPQESSPQPTESKRGNLTPQKQEPLTSHNVETAQPATPVPQAPVQPAIPSIFDGVGRYLTGLTNAL